MAATKAERNRAPGDLEIVRSFLNTWRISNETRLPTDTLAERFEDPEQRGQLFGDIPRGPWDRLDRLVTLRDALRDLLSTGEQPEAAAATINGFLADVPVGTTLTFGDDGRVVHHADPAAGLAGAVLAQVVAAMEDGTWSRLKACPDCQLVFFDKTRNGSKIWCGVMTGGPGGRACGSIAKVRRWRERQRTAQP